MNSNRSSRDITDSPIRAGGEWKRTVANMLTVVMGVVAAVIGPAAPAFAAPKKCASWLVTMAKTAQPGFYDYTGVARVTTHPRQWPWQSKKEPTVDMFIIRELGSLGDGTTPGGATPDNKPYAVLGNVSPYVDDGTPNGHFLGGSGSVAGTAMVNDIGYEVWATGVPDADLEKEEYSIRGYSSDSASTAKNPDGTLRDSVYLRSPFMPLEETTTCVSSGPLRDKSTRDSVVAKTWGIG